MAVAGNDHIGRSAVLTSGVGTLFRLVSMPRAGRSGGVWAVEITLAVLLAWVLGLLLAAILKPLPETQLVVPPGAAGGQPGLESRERLNPFRTASVHVAPDRAGAPLQNLAETTLNLVLYGTWVAANGGAAFIGSGDDDQKRYSVGDNIVGGVTLENVYRDQVTISRGGVSEVLKIKNWRSVGEPFERIRAAPAAGSETTGVRSKQGANFTDIVRISAQRSLGEGTRFALKPAGDLAAFEALGLKEGDFLVSIDEFEVASAPASIGPAIRQLKERSETTIIVNRGGVEIPVLILIPEDGERSTAANVKYEN